MGLYLIYCEILLSLISSSGEHFPSPCFILFSFSVGLLADAVLFFFKKSRKLTSIVLSVLVSLYFALECTLKVLFGVYFSVSNMMSSAENVMSHYGGDTLRGVILGFGFLLLFLLPAILCLVSSLLKKHGVRLPFVSKSRLHTFVSTHVAITSASLLLLAVIIHLGTASLVMSGNDGVIYKTHFNFRDGVETFGLTEATYLSLIRGETTQTDEGFVSESFIMTDKSDNIPIPPETTAVMTETVSVTEMSVTETITDNTVETAESLSESMPAMDETSENTGESMPSETETEVSDPVPEYNVMDITLPYENVPTGACALSEYMAGLEPSLKNDKTGLFSGKNLIMICAESYDDAFIRPELTPTLYRLTHNGFYFSDYYQPSWGGSTSTGELSMLLGLDSTDGAEAFQNIADNDHYFSMGRRLSKQGYLGACFHNGSHTFYRRDLTHVNLGYDEFYACGKNLEDFTGHSYPSDSEMLEGTLPYYIDHYLSDNQPFNLYYMTVTGHAPYIKGSLPVQEFWTRVDEILGDEYEQKTKYYICYQMELEKMLTRLVDLLEDHGIADDTVIVLTADHYPYGLGNNPVWGNDKNYNNDLKKEKTGICFNADKTGLIIWSGCLEHEHSDEACEVNEPVFSLDILPTLLNLFGIEFDSRLLPGRDVFGGTVPLVYWNNLSWITDKGRYLTKGHSFTPAEGVTFTPEEETTYIESVNIQVSNRIKMSTSIMKYDYYRLIFDK